MPLSALKKIGPQVHLSFQLFLLFTVFSFFIADPADLSAAIALPANPSVVAIETIPEIPGPSERVTLLLTSYSVDLDRALIVWTVNGKEAIKGVGKKQFSFTLGGVGSVSVVRIDVRSGLSGTITNTLTFNPGYVDMLWEAIDSYVPPFYKGKALPASQAALRVTAVPTMASANKTPFAPESLVYQWKQDFKYSEFYDQSGFNKQSVVLQKNILSTGEFIEAEVSSLSGKDGARGNIFIEQYSPDIIFYKDDPLIGIDYTRALSGTFSLSSQEVNIVAEPYYFSSRNGKSDLLFAWRLDNKALPADEGGTGEIVFRQEGGVSGTAGVSVEASRPGRILQFANETLSLVFGNTSSSKNLFGI